MGEEKRLQVMRCTIWVVWGVFGICAFHAAEASKYSIPADKVDAQKIFLGTANGFDKPGMIDYEAVIKATPEYGEIKKQKIEPGTGKYWILMSQASNRAVKAISEVAQETGHDFVAAQDYFSSLNPTIPAEDITPLVVEKLKPNGKKGGKEKKK